MLEKSTKAGSKGGINWLARVASLWFCVMLIITQTYAQQRTISGSVKDSETSEAIPGVSIVVKGTTSGTVTNVDGTFQLQAAASDVLVVSYVGYITQELQVGNQSSINVSMNVDVQSLQEVVVVGYTSESKQLIKGAMSQVNVSDAMKVPMQNAGQALQGRASGVHVVSSGTPGSTPLIRVRGFGTTNDNGPLIVIDGMQTTDASILAQINPGDIEAINVLKDASAAIYGARASNGVIIVTTKSGQRGDVPTVSFSTYTGFQTVGKTPELLNSQQLGDVIWQSYLNDGITPSHPQYGSGPSPVIPQFIRGTDALPYNEQTNKITRASQGTDWLDEIFRTAPIQNYDLSVQGGGEKSRYMMSQGYQNQQGIQLNTGFERYVTRLNTEFDVNKNVRLGEHMNVSYTNTLSQNQFGLAMSAPPLVPVYDEGGNFAGSGPSTAAGLSNTNNPVAELERGKDNFNKNIRVIGDAYAEISFLEDFVAKSSIGISYNHRLQNLITRLNPEAPEPRATNTLRELTSDAGSWVWSNTLRWNKDLGDHKIALLGGVEAVSEDFRQTEISVSNFLLEDKDFFLIGAGTGAPSVQSSIHNTSTLFSYLFNADYNYKNKYLASFSVRRDKTSRFSSGYNSGVFPSGSIGWILSEEEFLRGVSTISLLKLRGSYGLLGNQDIPVPNPNVNLLVAQQEIGFYSIDGTSIATGAILRSLGNPNLKWEISRQMNVGFDLGVFDNSLGFSFDYFNNTTLDMIVANPLPSTSIDANPPYINAGEVSNKGVDLSLTYRNNNSESGLKWDVSFNLSAYKNELVKINDNNPDAFLNGSVFRSGIITRSSNGLPISYYYGRDVIGIFQNEAEVSAAPDQGFSSPAAGVGRFRYRDIDKNGVINDDDRTILGNPHPDFTYGVNFNASYRNFFATAFIQGVQGNEVYHFTKIGTDFPSFLNSNRNVRVLDSWTETNASAELPALSTSIRNNESQPNSYFVEEGSYMRLRNLQVGYNFGIAKWGVKNARIYLQGTNLITLSKYLGADPEMGTGNAGDDPNPPAADLTIGVDTGRFPYAKSYLLGLSFSF